MFIHHLEQDIPVLCKEVPTFPEGIQAAFEELCVKVPDRVYYGLSHMENSGRIVYQAAAVGTEQEAAKLGYSASVIPQGDWLVESIDGWMEKIDGIKDVFGRLMSDPRFDPAYECVEWYRTDTEMWCMVRCVATN
ncbi:hypothetical protein [Paraflavitalea pollutisoli]|uniref:hypothetical protein n=1 Tax=Paraflavitalea pollutisoli TaxID=3034143 RepID=UPI0023EAB25B|nr:hypothetical protein [Paraflavitalea sp. H1-2-19X]